MVFPDFFENRFSDKSRILRVISALVILLFFTFSTSSGLAVGAILFENSFGLDYSVALVAGTIIIVCYTFIGGFLAVVWTDAIQAILMLLALVIAPIAVITIGGGASAVIDRMQLVNPESTSLFSQLSFMSFISLIA